ncbi:MAG TPA: copper transporter [Rubrobacteraceae bacterium]|nr:copper transporter [Rubrobacteraceae bacterium]
MPDLRYHLISLISVFLALAIGILLGVAMADRGVVSDRMEAEITSIQQQFAQQQEEIGKKNEQLAEQQGVLDGMSRVVVAGSLQGMDVALVTGPYADGGVAGDVQSDLGEAGANIVIVRSLEPPEPTEITLLETTSPQAMTSLEREYANFAREILGLTGEVEETPELVVFVGGGSIPAGAPPNTRDALRDAQAEMFEVWLEGGVRVIAAEPLRAGRTEVALFKNSGIPSVTNADEPAGRAAIVACASAESCEGAYGTKESATDPFPSPS